MLKLNLEELFVLQKVLTEIRHEYERTGAAKREAVFFELNLPEQGCIREIYHKVGDEVRTALRDGIVQPMKELKHG